MSVWFMFISSRGSFLWFKKSQLNLPFLSAQNHSDQPANLGTKHRQPNENWITAVQFRHDYKTVIFAMLLQSRHKNWTCQKKCDIMCLLYLDSKANIHLAESDSYWWIKRKFINYCNIFSGDFFIIKIIIAWKQRASGVNNNNCFFVFFFKKLQGNMVHLPESSLDVQNVKCCCSVWSIKPLSVAIVTVEKAVMDMHLQWLDEVKAKIDAFIKVREKKLCIS